MIDWREAHAWQRGYSDARAGKDCNPELALGGHTGAYKRGYAVGAR